MAERSTQHATFEIERVYDATPKRLFTAFADRATKVKWFGPPELELEFSVGGREHFKASMPDGKLMGYDAFFHEIVSSERIVYAYALDFDETRISVSLVTLEFESAGKRTRFRHTEQAVYLDGGDTAAEREQGTRKELEKLAALFSDSA